MTWEEEFRRWLKLVVVGGVAATIVIVAGIAVADQKEKRSLVGPRFEKRHVEAKDNIQFEVWHDKEAGSEIVCVRGYDVRGATMQPNCWTTGRQWK